MFVNSASTLIKKIFLKNYLCKAPFSSIYISGDGNVTPCCFNRKQSFGNIYQQDIDEILNSNALHKFRETILKKEFPIGCEICKNHLQNKNYQNSGISSYSNFPIQKNKLSVIELELSYKCNLCCNMCRLNEENLFIDNKKPRSEKFNILQQLSKVADNLKLIRYYGGEPFFIDEYYKIWEYMINKNVKCEHFVQTNGTIFNKKSSEIINKGKFYFNVSLDTLNEENYNTIRKGANINSTLKNLFVFKSISEKNNKNFSISVCPMRINMYDLPDIINFCNKNNIYIFFNTVISPWDKAIWSLENKEITKLFNYYLSVKIKIINKVTFINNLRWKSFLNQIKEWEIKSLSRPCLNKQEFENAKQKIHETILTKTGNYIASTKTPIELNKLKTKIYSCLDEILLYVETDKIIEKIINSDDETLYQKVIVEDEINIKENNIIYI